MMQYFTIKSLLLYEINVSLILARIESYYLFSNNYDYISSSNAISLNFPQSSSAGKKSSLNFSFS